MGVTHAEQRLAELERDLAGLLANERALVTAPSPAGLCQQILNQAISSTGADAGGVFLVEERTGNLVCVAAAGEKAAALHTYALPKGRGIVGAVAESGTPILTLDAAHDPRHDRGTANRLEYPVGGILCVPVSHEGRTIAVLEVLTRGGAHKKFDAADVRLLELMAGQAARAIEAARLVEARMRAERLDALALVIRGVVHDVRNPLTFINGYAEMLAEPTDDPSRTKARDAIFRNVEDINEMLHELGEFARGEDTTHKKPGDVHDLVADIGRLFEQKARTMRVGIRLRKRGDGRMSFDPGKLRRAIANLVKNALEATPAGGQVVVSSVRRGNALFIGVRDTGKGIPAEVMSRIFEPFVTHGKKGGTGLGLSICRRFAEQHGGEVGCRSRMGCGTRFVIRLPL